MQSLWSRLSTAPLLPQNTQAFNFCRQNNLTRRKPLDILAFLQPQRFWNCSQAEERGKRREQHDCYRRPCKEGIWEAMCQAKNISIYILYTCTQIYTLGFQLHGEKADFSLKSRKLWTQTWQLPCQQQHALHRSFVEGGDAITPSGILIPF